MHYFHTHFNVYPNPQGKVDACNHKAAPNFSSGEVWIAKHVHHKPRCGEDVQQQVGAHESRTRPNVGQTEQHTQGDHEVQAVLKVGPLAPIQPVRVARPQHPVVDQVGRTPEQQKGLVVVVHDDVFVGLEELTHG